MDTEPQEVEQQSEVQQDDPKAGLVARRDQLIAQYNEHRAAITEQQQRLGQLQAQQLKLEGALMILGDLIGEQSGDA